MSKETEQEIRIIEHEFGKIVTERFPEFLRVTHAPKWRYFPVGKRAYCWTVEPARNKKGKMRYASWAARLSKDSITPLKSTYREHTKRKDAKARALAMWQKAKGA